MAAFPEQVPQRTLSAANPVGRSARCLRHEPTLPVSRVVSEVRHAEEEIPPDGDGDRHDHQDTAHGCAHDQIRSERLRSVRLHRSGSVSLKKAREEEQREGGREHEVDHQIGNG